MRLLILLLTFVLSSCGGGGDNVLPCSTEKSFTIQTIWSPNVTAGTRIDAKVNVPLVATPTVTGIPASCKGQERFAVGAFSPVKLPVGLSIDAATGVISGTPVQVGSFGSSHFIDLLLPGYGAVEVLSVISVTP
jgi:Putative Ig domain